MLSQNIGYQIAPMPNAYKSVFLSETDCPCPGAQPCRLWGNTADGCENASAVPNTPAVTIPLFLGPALMWQGVERTAASYLGLGMKERYTFFIATYMQSIYSNTCLHFSIESL